MCMMVDAILNYIEKVECILVYIVLTLSRLEIVYSPVRTLKCSFFRYDSVWILS